MIAKLDWKAPIKPGMELMGFELGISEEDVRTALMANQITNAPVGVIQFPNSPRIILDHSAPDQIILRAENIIDAAYPYQTELANLFFNNGQLSDIIVSAAVLDGSMIYAGKLFGTIGLSSPVSALDAFTSLSYDREDELFIPAENLNGLLIAGSGSCSLEVDADQTITLIRIFDFNK